MNVGALVREIRRSLKAQADPRRRDGERSFFKEPIRNYGVTVPKCRAVGREIYRECKSEATEAQWLSLAERLLAGDWLEDGHVAIEIAGRARRSPSRALFATYERWLRSYISNWAHCDGLCTGLIGPVLAEIPSLAGRVRGWTASPNRWVRRGAAVSLVVPARRGLFLDEALQIAEALLADEDDLVQKGCGWMLREQAEGHRADVTTFLETHVRRMPRTAFRYAIEKFPPAERTRMMAL